MMEIYNDYSESFNEEMATVLRLKNLALVNNEILKTFNQSWDTQSECLC